MIPRFVTSFMPRTLLLISGLAAGLLWSPQEPPKPPSLVEEKRTEDRIQEQVEFPKGTFEPQPISDADREKDPLFQQIRKWVLQDPQSSPRSTEVPSLSIESGPVGQQVESVSSKEWQAIEWMLGAARLLEEETLRSGSNNAIRNESRTAIAKRIRTEVLTLLQTPSR